MLRPDDSKKEEGRLEIASAWKGEAEKLFGAEGAQGMKEVFEICSAYSPEGFSEDPAVQLEVREKTIPLREKIMQGFMQTVKEKHISHKGLLKKDPAYICAEYEGFFTNLDPEIFSDKQKIVFGSFADALCGRIMGYMLSLFAKDEKSYRKKHRTEKGIRNNLEAALKRRLAVLEKLKNLKDRAELDKLGKELTDLGKQIKRSPLTAPITLPSGGTDLSVSGKRPFGEFYFNIIDNPIKAMNGVVSDSATAQKQKYNFANIYAVFNLAKYAWPEMLNGVDYKDLQGTSLSKLREENDRVFEIWQNEEKRDISMSTTDEKRLTKKTLGVQLSPIEETQGKIYPRYCLQVNYYEAKRAKKVATDRKAQEEARPIEREFGEGGREVVSLVESSFPPVYLDRHTGEIESLAIGHQAIKALAKDPRVYELIRKNVIFYLAQLTCSEVTLHKMYGGREEPIPRGKGGRSSVHGEGGDDDKKDPKLRRYPYGDYSDPAKRAAIVFKILAGEEILYQVGDHELESEEPMSPAEVREAVENLKQSLTRDAAVSHRRLLHLVKDFGEDGEVVVSGKFTPSDEARGLAKKHGRILRRGIEFPKLGQTFYPEDLNDLFKEFDATTLEEVVERFPGEAFIRYETWVVPGRKEQDDAAEAGEVTKRAVRAVIPPRDQ